MLNTKLTKHVPGVAALRSALALALMGIATTTIAGKPGNITEAEMAMIPAYCPYTQSFSESRGSPEAKRWESLMGKDFWAMHHYCWAQINQQRAMRSSMSENGRKALLNVARGDYVYVINSAARNFVLLPEVYTRAGEVELRLSLYREANQSFAKARALKPDYWPAYSHWAEFLMYSGKKAEAKQLVKSGLEYSPNSRVLRAQYRLLGGNPSEIEPRAPVQGPENTAEEPDSPPTAGQPTPGTETNEATQVDGSER